MLSDDVFRDQLEQTLIELESWAHKAREYATINIIAGRTYWSMAVEPYAWGACPMELIFKADQTFGVKLGSDVFENKPIEGFELFPQLAEAVEAGRIERIERHSATTGALLAIDVKIELESGFDWIGVHRVTRSQKNGLDQEEQRTHRYLPYRR